MVNYPYVGIMARHYQANVDAMLLNKIYTQQKIAKSACLKLQISFYIFKRHMDFLEDKTDSLSTLSIHFKLISSFKILDN
ncbi:hypothetical protein BpHYR1_054314 [Brachionus plicatilis]|uniref:Uncharacterized protein n=1 Tax=Brachionus plicatilis TaxID=10195 RepID=A0A3M7T5G0_BRAPC|nr:hypothetical protein BpHYR1_054314 [Brachionus plicatilis]